MLVLTSSTMLFAETYFRFTPSFLISRLSIINLLIPNKMY